MTNIINILEAAQKLKAAHADAMQKNWKRMKTIAKKRNSKKNLKKRKGA